MRLIDADKLKKIVKEEPTDGMYTEEIIDLIDEQTTAYDVDKIVKQLNEWKMDEANNFEDGINTMIRIAIKIVKAGGING